MAPNRRLEDRIEPAIERTSLLIYGDSFPILSALDVVIVHDDKTAIFEIPQVLEVDSQSQDEAKLHISPSGGTQWKLKLENQCAHVDIDPLDLYVGSGLAEIELISAARSSLDGDLSIMPRVVKTYKALDTEAPLKQVAVNIQELTEISVVNIIAAFNHSEFIKLNMLRYGIGIALKSLGLTPKQIREFGNQSRDNAAISLQNYFVSAAQYLATHAYSKEESVEKVGEVLHREPPILEIAASAPMNVTYLLEK